MRRLLNGNKNIRKVMGLFLVVLVMFGTGACSLKVSPEELMTSPELNGQNKMIQELVKRNVPENAKFESVESERGISTFKKFDLDGDAIDEIIVFYSIDGETDPLHMLIFRKKNDSYSFVSDVSIKGKLFDKVHIGDVTSDGKKDITVRSLGDNRKFLSIYSSQEEFKKLIEIDYAQFIMQDVDEDGRTDFVIFKNENDILSADYYRYEPENGQIQFVNEIIDYSYFENIIEPKVADIQIGKKGIILEGTNSADSTGYTLVFGIDKVGGLTNLIKKQTEEGVELVGLMSFESNKLEPKDIDGDEIVEIPQSYPMIESGQSDMFFNIGEYAMLTHWYKVNPQGLEEVNSIIYLDGESLHFEYPGNWRDQEITGRKVTLEDKNEVIFSKADSAGESQILMKIVETVSEENEKGLELIKEKGGKKYYIYVNKDIKDQALKNLAVDVEEIAEGFVVK